MPAARLLIVTGLVAPDPEPLPPAVRVQLQLNAPAAPEIVITILPVEDPLQVLVSVVTILISLDIVETFAVLKTLPHPSVRVTVIGQEVLLVTEGGVKVALVLSDPAVKLPPQEADHATV